MNKRKMVDGELYKFLCNHELSTYYYQDKTELEILLWVDLFYADDFKNAFEESWFDEGGIDCKIQWDTVCINIKDYFDYMGYEYMDYIECFDNRNEAERNIGEYLKND